MNLASGNLSNLYILYNLNLVLGFTYFLILIKQIILFLINIFMSIIDEAYFMLFSFCVSFAFKVHFYTFLCHVLTFLLFIFVFFLSPFLFFMYEYTVDFNSANSKIRMPLLSSLLFCLFNFLDTC